MISLASFISFYSLLQLPLFLILITGLFPTFPSAISSGRIHPQKLNSPIWCTFTSMGVVHLYQRTESGHRYSNSGILGLILHYLTPSLSGYKMPTIRMLACCTLCSCLGTNYSARYDVLGDQSTLFKD